jgi:hypothetical protein
MDDLMRRIKMSWPEVVGWAVVPAISKIHADRPDINEVEIRRNGEHVPAGHNHRRVRLFTTSGDHEGTVTRTPVVG